MNAFLGSLSQEFSTFDIKAMALAIQLAKKGLYTTSPNPRVGCVLSKNQQITATGWHRQAGYGHAEVEALKAAGDQTAGCTAYVTLEPCSHHGRTPPCCEALIQAGITRVIAAMIDPNPKVAGAGLKKLHDAGIEVAYGLLQSDAEALNPGFIKRMTLNRPLVRAKLATSLDGKTAMASGESKWITGPASRADVQRWRARSCAIVMGVESVLSDNPSMNVRLKNWLGDKPESWQQNKDIRQPLRVILDSQLRTPLDAGMFSLGGKTLIITSPESLSTQTQRIAHYQQAGAEIVSIALTRGHIDLTQLLIFLAQREINEVLVESGSTLTGVFLNDQLIDELIYYIAPKLMGHAAQSAFRLPGLDTMSQCISLDIKDLRQVGQDVRIIAAPQYQE